MSAFMRKASLLVFAVALASCSGQRTYNDDDLVLEDSAAAPADNGAAAAPSSNGDDFSDFDADTKKDAPAQAEAPPPASPEDELKLDDAPPANADAAVAPVEPAPVAEAPAPQAEPAPEPIPEPVPVTESVPMAEAPAPAPMPEPAPAAPAPSGSVATITSVKYKANDNGGTVLIEANAPVTYTTRANPELHQLIVEVPDAVLPKRLQRPLNTRDIQGSIGAIDPYQNAGSNVARFVVQLREGAQEPVVQQEGNTILVIANAPASAESSTDLTRADAPTNVDLNDSKILSSQSLSEFLAGNTKFYGKRISLEMNNMDIRDALRFVTEESGVNMVVAEEVKGTISLKLRQVPWDQALVVIMKAKRLGYARQGNVLRIATQDQLKQEEDDATKLAVAKRTIEPLKVRMFQISYAQVAELEKRVTGFLTERGKVVGDTRTNSLVVTDIGENLDRVGKLISSLDTQPPQVLIEAKIIEATESFTRSIGVNWGFDGAETRIGHSKSGPVNMTPSLQISPMSTVSANGGGVFSLNIGRLDFFGDINASLALQERDDKVKIISSPRVVTLSNETANISQTTEVPIRSSTSNGTQTQFSYTFKPLVLKLEVTPQITADAAIIMKVNLKREFRGATQDASAEVFPVNSREANTRVLVKNGQTAVIGGIYQSDATEGEHGVPYLRDIPLIGALFRERSTTKDKSELLLFLTPRMLAQTDSGAAKPAPAGEM